MITIWMTVLRVTLKTKWVNKNLNKYIDYYQVILNDRIMKQLLNAKISVKAINLIKKNV